ncbi:MAG: alanine racemase [Armatimonadetes bacterium]|nr:alanine racemase [Candidatus Hippobium faecium]
MANPDIWVEVSKNALIHNHRTLKNYISEKTKLCCVLKANAYSHDLIQTAKLLEKEKADYFGLTHLDEALEVRHSGVNTPIILFMPVAENRIKEAISHNIDMTCASLFDAENINRVAENINRDAHIHIKIETGMGRLGILQAETEEVFQFINSHPRLKVEGTYTHFTHSGDSNVKFTNNQFSLFQRITTHLKRKQYNLGMLHCSNSGATLRFPHMQLDMVRCGTALFGQFPSVYTKVEGVELKHTWTLKARIVAIRNLPPGQTVGYCGEYTTPKNTKTAVIACGFSHGYTLVPESLVYRM